MTDEPSSLKRLLACYSAWSLTDTFRSAARRADAAGNAEAAARLRAAATAGDAPTVSALEALAAQREVAARLSAWEWHTVCAAREEGATWADIAHVTGTSPDHARRTFVDEVDQAERLVPDLTDIDRYRAAAGPDVRDDGEHITSGAPGASGLTAAAQASALEEGADEDRAAQLERWHADDDAADDDAGWSR